MNHNIIGAVAAAVSGLLVAFLNYLLSKKVLEKSPDKYSLVTVARQIIQIGFIVAVHFIGTEAELCNVTYLLIGAVMGMTLPMIFFTKKLIDVNELTAQKINKTEKEKGDETDG